MTHVHISKQHEYDEDECREVAEELLDMLVDKFGGRVRPDGNKYHYKHTTGISALVEANAGEVTIKVKLGMLTRSFAPQLEKEINRILDEHIA